MSQAGVAKKCLSLQKFYQGNAWETCNSAKAPITAKPMRPVCLGQSGEHIITLRRTLWAYSSGANHDCLDDITRRGKFFEVLCCAMRQSSSLVSHNNGKHMTCTPFLQCYDWFPYMKDWKSLEVGFPTGTKHVTSGIGWNSRECLFSRSETFPSRL